MSSEDENSSDEESSKEENEESSKEENEDCGFWVFKQYKKNMQPLSEPTIETLDEKRTYTYIDEYIDDDNNNNQIKFIVVTEPKIFWAYVESIQIGEDIVFSHLSNPDLCHGSFTENYIEVSSVNMGSATGKGICTNAVAYLIKTLMLEAETCKNWFPHKGHVHLKSSYVCAASHCYFKAFMLNGYDYSDDELHNFIDEIKGSCGDYRFKDFTNEEQLKKANGKRKLEKSSDSTVAKKNKLNLKLKF